MTCDGEKYLLVEIIEPSQPVTQTEPTWKPYLAEKRGYEPRERLNYVPTWIPHALDVTPIPAIGNPNRMPTWQPNWNVKAAWKPTWNPYAKMKY